MATRAEEKFKVYAAKRFGNHLRKLRQRRGLTQEQLAFEAGLSAVYVSNLEQGKYLATFQVILKLANALKKEVPDFFVGF